jgi:hypothetical protein
MLRSCGTKPNNLPCHTLGPTLPSQPSFRRRYPGPESNSPVTTICVTLRRRSRAVTMWPTLSRPRVQLSSHNHPCDPPETFTGSPSPCDPKMFSQVFLTFDFDNTGQSGAAESGPARFTHESVPLQTLSPPEPTTTGPGPNSTQKTSLMGEDYPPPICCAPPPSISDVGLNPTIVIVYPFSSWVERNTIHLAYVAPFTILFGGKPCTHLSNLEDSRKSCHANFLVWYLLLSRFDENNQ